MREDLEARLMDGVFFSGAPFPNQFSLASPAPSSPGQPIGRTRIFDESVGPLNPLRVEPTGNVKLPTCAPMRNQHSRGRFIVWLEIVKRTLAPPPRFSGIALVHGFQVSCSAALPLLRAWNRFPA